MTAICGDPNNAQRYCTLTRIRTRIEGRAIPTIGYRGMHSYEVAFDNWFVPAENLIGSEAGLGRGFYLQMAGFENGRLQTAARAVGLMQAAFEAGLAYAQERKVFGKPVFEYQLSKAKLARMAALIQAGRQFSYDVARKMAAGEGTLEACGSVAGADHFVAFILEVVTQAGHHRRLVLYNQDARFPGGIWRRNVAIHR